MRRDPVPFSLAFSGKGVYNRKKKGQAMRMENEKEAMIRKALASAGIGPEEEVLFVPLSEGSLFSRAFSPSPRKPIFTKPPTGTAKPCSVITPTGACVSSPSTGS